MRQIPVAEYVRERIQKEASARQVGPFVTISRQYGCCGYSLAIRMAELLNADADPQRAWKVYGKEALSDLAEQTHMPLEAIEHQRRHEARMIEEFFRRLSPEETPSCWELRRRITMLMYGLAADGHAIIVGHGGACATGDLANGLSIRLEAPRAWRIRQIVTRQGIDEATASRQLREGEREREFLRRFYQMRHPRSPVFNLVYDCSVFTPEEIARHVTFLMRMRKIA